MRITCTYIATLYTLPLAPNHLLTPVISLFDFNVLKTRTSIVHKEYKKGNWCTVCPRPEYNNGACTIRIELPTGYH